MTIHHYTMPDSRCSMGDTRSFMVRNFMRVAGILLLFSVIACVAALVTWSSTDPSLSYSTKKSSSNLLGAPGAIFSDIMMQSIGLASFLMLLPAAVVGWRLLFNGVVCLSKYKYYFLALHTLSCTLFFATIPVPAIWPLSQGLGGIIGDLALHSLEYFIAGEWNKTVCVTSGILTITMLAATLRTTKKTYVPCGEQAIRSTKKEPFFGDSDFERSSRLIDLASVFAICYHWLMLIRARFVRFFYNKRAAVPASCEPDGSPLQKKTVYNRRGRFVHHSANQTDTEPDRNCVATHTDHNIHITTLSGKKTKERRYLDGKTVAKTLAPILSQNGAHSKERGLHMNDMNDPPDKDDHVPEIEQALHAYTSFDDDDNDAGLPISVVDADHNLVITQPECKELIRSDCGTSHQFPPITLLIEPKRAKFRREFSEESLESHAGMLENVLEDFGIRGEIVHVKPGPVVTLYELRPAPGVKSSRIIGLADDIARSMSAVSARVAVIPGHNIVGIELPNQTKETVYLREMLGSKEFRSTTHKLALCLGKTIGGESVIVDLARMPHLLIAGTTGSGKSVAINTMIMSLLYRLTPEECKFIMVDPKMLELSVYAGIPHLLTPVVTDPKKAVVALKWTVKEMERRYKKMSKLGVRSIDGYNARVDEAKNIGEVLTREVQTGFHRQTGEPIYETEELELDKLAHVVLIVDEMADLMMVAGKEIEAAIQRLAQMSRAAGIHIILATQRPSVDVITGTLKANFPTRISFQVTSKIDSRTILGEQGAEQLLGQGDMLYMAPGYRTQRVHCPLISDQEVEKVVQFFRSSGEPEYLWEILAENNHGRTEDGRLELEEASDLYNRALAVVLRDRKASTSYIQRRFQIGYNRAASIIERMEREGVISQPTATGKREILLSDTSAISQQMEVAG